MTQKVQVIKNGLDVCHSGGLNKLNNRNRNIINKINSSSRMYVLLHVVSQTHLEDSQWCKAPSNFILSANPFFMQSPNFLKDRMCQDCISCVPACPSICTAACSKGEMHLKHFFVSLIPLPYKEGFADTWRKALLISQLNCQAGFRFKIQHIWMGRLASLNLTFFSSKTRQGTGRENNATELQMLFCKTGQLVPNLVIQCCIPPAASQDKSASNYKTTLVDRICAFGLEQTPKKSGSECFGICQIVLVQREKQNHMGWLAGKR